MPLLPLLTVFWRCWAAGQVALAAGLHGTKMIMVIMADGKVIMRLPSTGAKVIKMITYMEMGDTFDRCDSVDTSTAAGWGRWRLAKRVGANLATTCFTPARG